MDLCTPDAKQLLTCQNNVFNDVRLCEAGLDESDFTAPLKDSSVTSGASTIVAWTDVEDESARWIWYNPAGEFHIVSNCENLIAMVEEQLDSRHPWTTDTLKTMYYDTLPYELF